MPRDKSLTEVIGAYRQDDRSEDTTHAQPPGREPSWDYCYRWFNKDRSTPFDERRDCLELGYYMANWGMFRGSGKLMTTNLATWRDALRVIDDHHEAMQQVDLRDDHDEWMHLDNAYRALQCALPGDPSSTLVTKVMLGVWGCVPAMDTYVLAGIRHLRQRVGDPGLGTFNRRFYGYLSELRLKHEADIEHHRDAELVMFGTSETWSTRIPAGKVLDMYLFQVGR